MLWPLYQHFLFCSVPWPSGDFYTVSYPSINANTHIDAQRCASYLNLTTLGVPQSYLMQSFSHGHLSQVLRTPRVHHALAHNSTPPSTLLTPSLNTYPIATGLAQVPFPASTPTGAFFNLSVKKTGCRVDASNITCRSCDELTGRVVGGIASIWVLGAGGVCVAFALHILEARDRVGCWFMGVEMDRGGGFCCWKLARALSLERQWGSIP